jgi:glutaminase
MLLAENKPPPSMSKLPSPIQSYLQELHTQFKSLREGEVATYIPELGKADPDWFGICVVTCDGQVYEVGDTRQEFTIQSISKPLTYGIALQDSGKETVLSKVWMEPSGEAFNSISLDPSGRPMNPMINAGAIATTGLVEGRTTKQKVARILDTFSRYAGRPLTIDHAVAGSESETGHRNRAIAYMLRNFEIFADDPMPSLEAYFQQCSILINCLDLAFMGATLANDGIHPITGQRAVGGVYVESILSVMASCGMYDAAGEWLYNVGMPAKSGVGGGILAVLPGQLSVAVFSPLLDARGNSARGIAVCREISARYNLHLFNTSNPGMSVIRHRTSARRVSSNRARPTEEAKVLREHGDRIQILEVQGRITFGPTERVIRELYSLSDSIFAFILDFNRVQQLDHVSSRVLLDTFEQLAKKGVWIHVTNSRHLPVLARVARKRYGANPPVHLRWDDDADTALEFCENRLIESLGERRSSSDSVPLERCDLVEGFSADELATMERLLTVRHFDKGSVVFEAGQPASELLIILQGKASICLDLPSGQSYRVTTCTPGMTFGEMALLDHSPRSATVRADTDIVALALSVEDFAALSRTDTGIYSKLLTNIARHLASRLRKRNAEVIDSHL